MIHYQAFQLYYKVFWYNIAIKFSVSNYFNWTNFELYHDDKFVCDFKEKSKIFNNYFCATVFGDK